MNEHIEDPTIRLSGRERYLQMNSVELYIHHRRYRDRETRVTLVPESIVWRERAANEVIPPFLTISCEDFKIDQIPTLQHLMDDLWRLGYRPTEAHAGDARVEAIKYHLEDMRMLAGLREKPGAE